MNVKRPLLILGIALVVLTLGVPAPGSAELPPGTTEIEGDWKGALYALYVPVDWNGDLVLYAHGFVARQDPIALPDPEIPGPYGSMADFRDALLGQGYAIGLSSYSTTGWAVEEGFFETRHLLPLFTSYFGRPDRLYVMGHSMGGLITLRLTEKHPGLIDGALPMCGPIGGMILGVEHVQHVRALFDYYYPGVLPGDALHVPDPYTALDVYFMAFFAMVGDTRLVPGWYELGQIEGLDLPADPNQLFESILARIWFQAGLDLMERTGGKSFWGNADTRYTGSFDDEMLNSFVDRYEATCAGQAYLRRWYEPTGKLRTPTLTLHNAIDGLVPLSHEAAYAQKVATRRHTPNLVQRTVDRFGHCAFTAEEQVEAFVDLVTWVETGVKPAP